MKVLLYGEPVTPGCGSWSYLETMREMGHEMFHFDSWAGVRHYWSHPVYRIWWRLTRRLRETDRRAHVGNLIEMTRRERPDIVIVLKGLFIGPEDVRALKDTGAWVAIINHDDFFSLDRVNVSAEQRAALPEWDFVFACRQVNVDEIEPLNPNVEFFRFAYNPRVHYPVPVDPQTEKQWVSDVVFVGTFEKDRVAMMEHLVRNLEADYAVWGGQWHKLSPWSPLRPHVRGAEIRLDDQCRAIGGAKINLGFLRKINRDLHTTRTFEIPACDGVLLAERTSEHEALYRDGVDAEFFDADDPDDLVDKVRRLLADDQRRESIRRSGREALQRGKHAYRDRLERVFELYEVARA